METLLQAAPTFPVLLTPTDVAEVLRISRRQAYRLVERGELPVVRVGQTNVRVRAADLATYIEARTGEADTS